VIHSSLLRATCLIKVARNAATCDVISA